MELQLIPTRKNTDIQKTTNIIEYNDIVSSENNSPFIEANTKSVSLSHLKEKCIIPVFSKDNERTISHHEFIEVVQDAVRKVFPHHIISKAEIRVSHQIKGRVPSAINKSVNELLEHEKTTYYERMAFIIRIPSITDTINGNKISLTLGGVRAYNQENLYSKKTIEKFKFFVGFQNLVCCNLCVSSDGFIDEMRVGSYTELGNKVTTVLQQYQAEQHLQEMKNLTQYQLTEHQFAQLIGRMRLYQYLPKEQKAIIPDFLLNDGQISTIAKDFYQDERFCKSNDSTINLWNVYNLFTSANKSSYIDTFLNRNSNVFEFTQGLAKALNGNGDYHWFLS
ncbi:MULTISPECIES: DUF3871 family protein [Tenacibaculum]|uniref:Uncharacterized protein n=1 Tax=Tenacibaculum soleae TaxID=447689 RepID=A0A1B9Y2M8_9FLAO|nr:MULTISPECIES: DUF3871 family protein [Tenacibaculum]MCT4699167.1 DUF3871 family protein [Tenacibaculum haliotis]OCK44052.1 hypothetical protein BA195_04995 [Tenacibaculum soleae]